MAKDISRTLIIGLGGTGQSVIREVRKRLFRRYGYVPELVKFLSFDTDQLDYEDTPFKYYYNGENHETKLYNIQDAEFKQIGRPRLAVLRTDPVCQNLNFDKLERIYGLTNGVGANGYRIMGRAHFLFNSQEIMTVLINTVNELKNSQQLADAAGRNGFNVVPGVNVYIVASLAGGTGSSAFMDLSRMLQHAGITVVDNNADAMSDRIYGVFYLPSFFRTKPNTPNIMVNTYVALSELDHALNLSGMAEGSEERDNDNNSYNGDTGINYPVRFSNVFLVDKTTKKGNKHEFKEASSYVGSFLAACIAANDQKLESTFSNSTHVLRDLDGKKQFYSGMGYCEIRLNRQNLVKYLLNRQLRASLLKFKDGDADFSMDEVADKFIEDNQLNEGIKPQNEGEEDTRPQLNQLIDSIYKIEDKRFVNQVMSIPATGKDASADIVRNRDNFLTAIKAQVTSALDNFAERKRTISTNLKNLLDEYQAKECFGRFPDLAKRLRLSFTLMKEGLEEEIAEHEKQEQNVLESLQSDWNFIKNNHGKGFLGGLFGDSKEDAQKRRIAVYRNKVQGLGTDANPTLCRLALEKARKEEAVKVYKKLIEIVTSYYKEDEVEKKGKKTLDVSGTFLDVMSSFDQLNRLILAENEAYKPAKEAKNETILIDAYFKEYFEKNDGRAFEFTEALCANLYGQFSKILSDENPLGNNTVENLRNHLMAALPDTALIKKIQTYQMSLDQLFIECFGVARGIQDSRDFDRYPHLTIFSQLKALFDPLWNYGEFRGGNSLQPEIACMVGVYDDQFHILDKNNGYNRYLPKAHSFEFVNVGDPDMILFMLQEGAIPGFTLRDISIWKGDYDSKKQFIYSFSDQRLEGIDMLVPEALDENGEIAWAYGWLFGLIKYEHGRVRVKPSAKYMRNNRLVKDNYECYDYFGIKIQNPSDLAKCHREFIRDKELFQDIYDQAMVLLKSDPNRNIVRIAHWVNDDEMWAVAIRGKLRGSMREAERQVVEEEVVYLAKRFDRVSTPNLRLEYDETSGKVKYYDSLGVLDSLEGEYAEQKKNQEEKSKKSDGKS